MNNYVVRDGVQKLDFEGALLAQSSSRLPDKPRWVEFELYKTIGGQYVVSRTGISILYHAESCYPVTRNRLSVVAGAEVPNDYVPCPDCRPSRLDVEGVYPEKPRYRSWHRPDAQGIIDSLMKPGENGTTYMTNVVSRLLLDASRFDSDIHEAFTVSHID